MELVGNLIQRNLIRSSQVGLCSGEALASLYTGHYGVFDAQHNPCGIDSLTPVDIRGNDTSNDGLFAVKNANGEVFKDPKTGSTFQTPLFFYILKDAEKNGQPQESLGLVGSYLVGEVILGAIAWPPDISVLPEGKPLTGWTPAIGKARDQIKFLDLVEYVGYGCPQNPAIPDGPC